ncbi:DNA polymerase III subunit delta' [soil metagenome]
MDVFELAGVVGQNRAVAALRAAVAHEPVHAYLLVGPPGAGSAATARAFAAALLCPEGGDGTCRTCRLALAGEHPDVSDFTPEGANLRLPEVQEIIRVALRSPGEGARKVVVVHDLHRVEEASPAALLKTLEEPPASTVFVLLADLVIPELVTIASRSVRIDLPPLPSSTIEGVLVAEEVPPERAAVAAAAALGDLDRARLLAVDDDLARRQRLWRSLPERVDGRGSTAAAAVDELLEHIEEAAQPLRVRQAAELEAFDGQVTRTGRRGTGRKVLVEQHKRQARRHRTTELRFGLATLAASYRDALVAGGDGRAADAVDAITAATEALLHNPNETLLLQALVLRLPAGTVSSPRPSGGERTGPGSSVGRAAHS